MLKRKFLLATAASVAFASTGAFAFDDVTWTWNSDVNSTINHTANIAVDANPTGLVQVENIQNQTGDVNAGSFVNGMFNNASGGFQDGATVSVNEAIDLTAHFDPNAPLGPVSNVTINSPTDLTASNSGGTVNDGQANLTFNLEGDFAVDPATLNDREAVDLPMIKSASTAVGNNYAVDGTVSLLLDSSQTLQGNDTAISGIADIVNSAANSSATAVGNNMNVGLAGAISDADTLAIADITQTSGGAITATSSVNNVTLVDYAGFGAANMGGLATTQIPAVASAATAVGNNLAISVGGPAL